LYHSDDEEEECSGDQENRKYEPLPPYVEIGFEGIDGAFYGGAVCSCPEAVLLVSSRSCRFE
jgi:hypothetical protein